MKATDLSDAMVSVLSEINTKHKEYLEINPDATEWVHVNLFYHPSWYERPTSEGINLRSLNALEKRGMVELKVVNETKKKVLNPHTGKSNATNEIRDTAARLTSAGRAAISA